MEINLVGIITKRHSDTIRQTGLALQKWLAAKNIPSRVNTISPEMDLLVILGGDGTLLHVAAQAAEHDIPVVGINLGNLGFLTEIAREEMYPALETLLTQDVRLEKRMMLQVRFLKATDHQKTGPCYGLNEVVLVKGSMDRIIRLHCWADQEYVATYKSDGLILATPTGSTAYNLSAGGPIVHAELRALIATPICPFMLESRPVLLAPDKQITIQLADSAEDVKVLIDGHLGWEMHQDDCVVIEAAPKPLHLVSSPLKGYFAILRNKLNWGGKSRDLPRPSWIT